MYFLEVPYAGTRQKPVWRHKRLFCLQHQDQKQACSWDAVMSFFTLCADPQKRAKDSVLFILKPWRASSFSLFSYFLSILRRALTAQLDGLLLSDGASSLGAVAVLSYYFFQKISVPPQFPLPIFRRTPASRTPNHRIPAIAGATNNRIRPLKGWPPPGLWYNPVNLFESNPVESARLRKNCPKIKG